MYRSIIDPSSQFLARLGVPRVKGSLAAARAQRFTKGSSLDNQGAAINQHDALDTVISRCTFLPFTRCPPFNSFLPAPDRKQPRLFGGSSRNAPGNAALRGQAPPGSTFGESSSARLLPGLIVSLFLIESPPRKLGVLCFETVPASPRAIALRQFRLHALEKKRFPLETISLCDLENSSSFEVECSFSSS